MQWKNRKKLAEDEANRSSHVTVYKAPVLYSEHERAGISGHGSLGEVGVYRGNLVPVGGGGKARWW